ncbi:MAG: hypothetical protein M3071_09515 [Actinomycetota bacterium]|nr:hypothetical protein [Actinomycetota bacterium]
MTTKPPGAAAPRFPWGPLRIAERLGLPELGQAQFAATLLDLAPSCGERAFALVTLRRGTAGGALTLAHLVAHLRVTRASRSVPCGSGLEA